MNLKISILAVGLCLGGCATSYKPDAMHLGGFSETALAPDVTRIIFRGNSSTTPERAQDFALLRAAELAMKAGFPYFTVLKESNETNKQTVINDLSVSSPKTGILVQYLKDKIPGTLVYECQFLSQTLRAKYKID